MKFSDYAGTIHTDAVSAAFFVSKWFQPDDKICVTATKTERTGKYDVISQSLSAKDFVNSVSNDDLKSIIQDEEGNFYNLYINVCPIVEDVELTQRGKEDNVAYVPGVWADFDIKDGSFVSQSEIIDWIDTLAVEPTLVCGSGSGGIHAYWRLHYGEKGDKELNLKWWAYLNESAGDKHVDKLVDITRMLRLPGTTRFPKKEEKDAKPTAVSILKWSNATYSVQQIEELATSSFNRYNTRRSRIVNQDSNRRIDMDYFARSKLGNLQPNTWRLFRAIAYIEDIVNETYSWDEILVPYGWTYLRDLRDGSREFARPGRNERSAVVDYDGSPVMSLLSSAEETGLLDLKEAGIVLTKYRCLLRLHYDDNETLLIEDVLRNK